MINATLLRNALVVLVLGAALLFTGGAYAKDYHKVLLSIKEESTLIPDLIETLHNATSEDVVYIHITSPGGSVLIMTGILNAMDNSKAKVVTINEGGAYSAGAVILLMGDEIIINDNTETMVHVARWYKFGQVQLVPLDHRVHKLFFKVVDPAFSWALDDDELNAYVKGEDVFLNNEQLRARIALKHLMPKGRLLTKVKLELLKQQAERDKSGPKKVKCYSEKGLPC